jgi:hypothetical protein
MIRPVELTVAIARRLARIASALAALILPGTDAMIFSLERIAGGLTAPMSGRAELGLSLPAK